MRADKVLKAILAKEGLTAIQAARKMGKGDSYLSRIFSRSVIPRTDTMAGICDAVDYDLLVRSRADGYELLIDPPSHNQLDICANSRRAAEKPDTESETYVLTVGGRR